MRIKVLRSWQGSLEPSEEAGSATGESQVKNEGEMKT